VLRLAPSLRRVLVVKWGNAEENPRKAAVPAALLSGVCGVFGRRGAGVVPA
jgi:hypothetical protein